MNRLAIAFAIAALPALASAQTEGDAEAEGDVVFVDSSEVEIVVEEEEPSGPTFVEHEDAPQAEPAPQAQQAPPPPPPQTQAGAQAQVNLTVPNPQLQMRDDRALLRQELGNYPLGGPIAMLSVGIPIAAIFSYGAYLAYHTEDLVDCVADDCASPNRTATAVLGTIAGAGLVLATVGLITLIVRVGKRARVRQQFRRGELGALELGTIRF